MFHPKTLLLATDFSESAEHAAAATASLARQLEAQVHIVYVIEQLAGYRHLRIQGAECPPHMEMFVEHGQRELLALAERQFAGIPPEQLHLRIGRPHEEVMLAQGESEAALIIVGTRAERGLARVVRGSVAEKLITQSPVPVLSLQQPLELSQTSLLMVAIDFSEASRHAARVASGLASLNDSEVVLVSVLQPPQQGMLWPLQPSEPEEVAILRVKGELEALAGTCLSPSTRRQVQVRVGGVVEELIAEGGRLPAALLVMGAHGQSNLEDWLLGGVAERVMRSCQIPLLTCR